MPEHIRSDNSPEFTARVIRDWLARVGAKTLYIEPGSPWKNGYGESSNGTPRDELLNGEIFCSLNEARIVIERWIREYNPFGRTRRLVIGRQPQQPVTRNLSYSRNRKWCSQVAMVLVQRNGKVSINPWVVGFIILMLGGTRVFPYQCSHCLKFQEVNRAKGLYDEPAFL